MNLIATPSNPVPRNGEAATIRASDGLALRIARWPARGVLSKGDAAPGTLVICQGRGEFIEKYFEVVENLLARGFAVVAFDWRGQGGSARELDNSRKGHVRDFALYQRDIEAVAAQVLEPFCPKPWFAHGHSMGGAILLDHAARGGTVFERMVLSAPMINIQGLAWPALTRIMARTANALGFGASFVPGGGETSVATLPFEGNILTSDAKRYQRTADIVAHGSFLGLGSPTVAWLDAAFRLIGRFAQDDCPRQIAEPILIVAAGEDRVVDTRATARFAARLKAGRLIEIPGSRHEILVEQDVFRDRFWAAFDAFVPGARDELAALEEARLKRAAK